MTECAWYGMAWRGVVMIIQIVYMGIFPVHWSGKYKAAQHQIKMLLRVLCVCVLLLLFCIHFDVHSFI